LIKSNHVLKAQIESLVVERVKDFRIGLRPSRAEYIKAADLAVARRCRVLRGEGGPVEVLAFTS
jgi:hypothetical protein